MLELSKTSNKLQYLLKTLDNEESNNEIIIKNSKNNYVKSILSNTESNPFLNNTPNSSENNQPREERVHHQQCQQS